MRPAYHAVFVSLTTGTLVFSFLLLSFRFWFRPKGPTMSALWRASDAIALYSAMFGVLMLLLAFGTGILLRPLEALLNSPITKNKILMSVLGIISWWSFLAVRVRSGPALWVAPGFIAHFAYVSALAGLIFLLSTNSIGGDLAGIPSGYEELAKALGFRTRLALYFPTWVNIVLWIVGLAAVGLGFVIRRSARDNRADDSL
jgi:hypothetical protein